MLSMQKKLSNIFYVILSLPSTAMGFALSVQLAALSWILSTQYNLEIHEVGIVWAAGPLAGIFGQVIIGIISDKTWFWGGRRRPFILIGGTLAALMLLSVPNLQNIQNFFGISNLIIVAIMVALTLDLAINISFNPTRSIIADVTPEGIPRTKGYTWMQTVSGSFGVSAYLIGLIIDNYFLLYFGAALVFCFSVFPVLFIKEKKDLFRKEEETEQKSVPFLEIINIIQPLWGYIPFAAYFLILKLFEIKVDPHINDYLIIGFVVVHGILTAKTFLSKNSSGSVDETSRIDYKKILSAHSFSWIGVFTMFVYIFAYIQEMQFGNTKVELSNLQKNEIGDIINITFLLLNLVGAILPALVLEPLTEKIGRLKTHYLSVAVMSFGFLLIVLFGTMPLYLYIAATICGVGWAAIVSLPFAIMSEKVDKSFMGLYMGIFNLSVVLPQLIVTVGFGNIIQEASNKNIIFIISCVTLGISALLWTLIKEETTIKEESQITEETKIS
jgi:MFS family permease